MSLDALLSKMARESEWFWPVLVAARELNLPSWCIGAGAVRNLVWDALHGFDTMSELPDVDLVHFDPSDLSGADDVAMQCRLSQSYPFIPWEVTNQAAVHTWYETAFGYPVSPLTSLEDAISSWPEFSTCVGLTLRCDDTIDVIAPHGLDDLFGMVIRRNPARVSVAAYKARLEQKRYLERWPKVSIVLTD